MIIWYQSELTVPYNMTQSDQMQELDATMLDSPKICQTMVSCHENLNEHEMEERHSARIILETRISFETKFPAYVTT